MPGSHTCQNIASILVKTCYSSHSLGGVDLHQICDDLLFYFNKINGACALQFA